MFEMRPNRLDWIVANACRAVQARLRGSDTKRSPVSSSDYVAMRDYIPGRDV